MDPRDTLRNVKKAKSVSVRRAENWGAKDAEKDFPKILKKIERSGAEGGCTWRIDNLFPDLGNSLDWRPYCDGYGDRINELIDDRDFSVECHLQDLYCNFDIEW
jgi:hypothetical protein